MDEWRHLVEIPLSDLPPCMLLWSSMEIEKTIKKVMEIEVMEAWERTHREIERWMIEGEAPEGVSGLLGGSE